MLRMPPIILGLLFQTELGIYFETTIRWYSVSGELSDTPGFRMQELHLFLHDFIQPWWTRAKNSPREMFPRTFKYIDDTWKDNDDERQFRTQQIIRGINAGYKEILKMSKDWFSVPLIFLVLMDIRRAPSFMRAVNRLLCDNAIITPEDCATRNGRCNDEIMSITPAEASWHSKLSEDQSKFVHYFKQFGLHHDAVQPDISRLSKLRDRTEPGYKLARPLSYMKQTFPIIFEAMAAVFQLFPSNSRILEQLHGILRQAIKPGDTIKFTDCQSRYTSNCYGERKERKKLIGKKKPFDGHIQMKGKHTSGTKHDRTMDQVVFLGKQALCRKRKYTDLDQRQFPDDLKKGMKIRSIVLEGGTSMDKLIAERKKSAYDVKARNLNVEMLTEEEITREAVAAELTNDAHLRAQFNGTSVSNEHRQLIQKFMRRTYWNTMVIIKNEAPQVFPFLPSDSYLSLRAAEMKTKVKEHVKEIEEMARDPALHTMFDQDVTGKNEEERLELCVKVHHEGTVVFEELRREREDVERYQNIFGASGDVIVYDEWVNVQCALGNHDQSDEDDEGFDEQ